MGRKNILPDQVPIYYLFYVKRTIGNGVLITGNVICLLLLFNIVISAVLSAPTPFQQMAFEQPNVGVLHFPFTWLPCFIVPVVLFAHLGMMRQNLKRVIKRNWGQKFSRPHFL